MGFFFKIGKNPSRIGFKLVFVIILFSSIITLVTTAIQLFTDFHRDLNNIQNKIEDIKISQLKTLRHSLWNFDSETIQIQLESMLHIRGVEYLKLSSEQGESWQAGKVTSQYTISKVFNLYYDENKTILIGKLEVISGLDPLYQSLLDKILIILIGNAVKTFFVAMLALFVFRFLVSRHLIKIASYVKNMEFDDLTDELVLDGKKTDAENPDEIDLIISAINELKRNHTESLHQLKEEILIRRQAEENLQKSEERLRSIIEGTPAGYFFIDKNGCIQNVNNACLSMHQYTSRDQLIGKPYSEFQTEADMEEAQAVLRNILDGAPSQQGELSRKCRDGSIGYHTFTVGPVYQGDEIIGLEGFIIDITERKQAEHEREILQAKLAQAQKMESIGKLAGGIAHDFNNILASVLGYTELALEDIDRGSLVANQLQAVLTAGRRARDLVRQILTFARRTDEALVPTRVDHVVNEVLKFLRSTIPVTIDIESEIESRSFTIANQTQLHQVIMNLCTNATQAMEAQGGTLKISLKDIHINARSGAMEVDLPEGDYIELGVTDTGVGIHPEIIASIFEPYFTTKGLGEGTGLGLAMVHGIIESYGGLILVESTPGRGSTFTVYLPVTEKQVVQELLKPQPMPSGTERILFIDDEAALANMAKQILSRLGYQVTIQTSSLEALSLFRTNPDQFDLVITDMTMPQMTGDILAAQLMETRPDIPVILCTGYSKKMSESRASQIGIKAFAYKPVSMHDLANMVRNVLDSAKINNIKSKQEGE